MHNASTLFEPFNSWRVNCRFELNGIASNRSELAKKPNPLCSVTQYIDCAYAWERVNKQRLNAERWVQEMNMTEIKTQWRAVLIMMTGENEDP